ncbi:alpha/beta fold hydrolase [Paraglaciecola arctica]|uniref:alpha/beta fold hydrolase n=1 Tax=Paraglaciecola arctica TaxID=1128911 RepID=UPI001C06BC59|nr:alpha/beta hydrolase [Paraglaciecola arctica]MBU3005027.1 alpha/beta hydrolase [Paraglaciecola arctica]
MFKSMQAKSRRFWLTFTVAFIYTVLFQMAISGVLFAAENTASNKQFVAKVTGAGKPVILIPGLMSDGSVWQDLANALSTTYQVHIINLAGFASTPANDKPSLTQVKQQLLDYVDTHKLHKPAVIGHSLGGFMSFWLASSANTQIGPIISVDGLPFIGPVFTRTNATTVADLAGQAQQIKAMYGNMSQQQLIQQSRYGLSIQASSDEAKAKVMDMVKISDPKTVGEAIYTLMSQDLRQEIAKITSPVLLLGASGGFSTDDQHAAMQTLYAQQLQMLPKAQLVMNTRSRHFIMYDDPQWLEEQVTTFLGSHL